MFGGEASLSYDYATWIGLCGSCSGSVLTTTTNQPLGRGNSLCALSKRIPGSRDFTKIGHWFASLLTRRSLTGYMVLLGQSSLAWKTKKQPTVSKSSAEAEYHAMSYTSSELKWVRELLSCFGVTHDDPMIMFCDSQATLHIAANPVFHERIKYIEKDCHFIQDEIKHGILATSKVHTSNNLVDYFEIIHAPT